MNGSVAEVDPTSLPGLWSRFRGLPGWGQALAWPFAWPVLGALFVGRSDRLGKAAVPAGLAVLLIGGVLWLALFAGLVGASSTEPVAIDEPVEAEQPTPGPSPPATTSTPTPRATATATPDPEPDPTPDAIPATTTDGDLEVHFIDVGQADATLLLAPDATVLVDAGDWRRSDVVPYLRSQGVETIDLVIVTHPHADHIGQFDDVMGAFDVAEVWWSGASHTSQTYQRAVTALERSSAAYEEPRAGDTTTVGSLRFEVANPPGSADFSDLHDTSLSFRVTYGDVRFVFTGDAERSTESRMVRDHRGWLDADIYQVGHHGSRTSTSSGFLDAVSPSVAIYSAGQDSQYGHPHQEVLDRLNAAGIEVFGTAVHGTVVVTTDGSTWTVETGRRGTPAAPRAPPEESSGSENADDTPPATTAGCGSGQVDINAAGAEELREITHIGEVRAEEMLRIRPFRSVDDMRRINGIADGRLNDIRAQGVACVP